MVRVLLVIPPVYDRAYPPLGTPALAGFLKARGVDVLQEDLNIAFHEYAGTIPGTRSIPEDVYKDYPGIRYPFERIPEASYVFCERMLSSPVLGRYIRDGRWNPFHGFFEQTLPRIAAAGIGLLGISVTAPSQAIPALTLGYLIKARTPGMHVCLGGAWVSLYKKELRALPGAGEYFDSLVCFEGETALYRLVKKLRDRKTAPVRPALFSGRGEDLDALPSPDFTGLPLEKYGCNRDGRRTLTLETARGCYWGKCIFCAHLPEPKPAYREKDAGRLVRDMQTLAGRHGVRHFMVSNPVMSPRQVYALSRRLIAAKEKVSWDCMARFDPGFTRKVLAAAKKAGCEIMDFGLESANTRVSKFIRKGIDLKTGIRILRDCRRTGIEVNLQAMIGLPTETLSEALETIAFLSEHRDLYSGVVINVYHLMPNNPVYSCPKKFGIRAQKDAGTPFRFFHGFTHAGKGCVDKRQADRLIKLARVLGVRVMNYPA